MDLRSMFIMRKKRTNGYNQVREEMVHDDDDDES